MYFGIEIPFLLNPSLTNDLRVLRAELTVLEVELTVLEVELSSVEQTVELSWRRAKGTKSSSPKNSFIYPISPTFSFSGLITANLRDKASNIIRRT